MNQFTCSEHSVRLRTSQKNNNEALKSSSYNDTEDGCKTREIIISDLRFVIFFVKEDFRPAGYFPELLQQFYEQLMSKICMNFARQNYPTP